MQRLNTKCYVIFCADTPVQEGAFLYRSGINPYQGDMYHENPLVLVATNFLIVHCADLVPALFVLLDMLTGVLLYSMAKRFTREMVSEFASNAI